MALVCATFSYQTVAQDNVSDLRIGDRVRVENGYVYRY